MKKIVMTCMLIVLVSACGGKTSAPIKEDKVPIETESGFYENRVSRIGQAFLREVPDTIYFAYDSIELRADSLSVLNKQAIFIRENSPDKIIIEGHTDERGTREYNLALGEKRANVVKRYLESRGVPKGIIKVISYGKERPVVPLHTTDAWSKNRRAVTLLM